MTDSGSSGEDSMEQASLVSGPGLLPQPNWSQETIDRYGITSRKGSK
eukprot:CAMPEP_0168196950 /NCGR_PEP_ID=MMETSP0139_2-20121125/20855_1 /TAXON_ID=44445 /ORGANISM="Pseudo-nitzschia australis, Strain 10249 10 AB" /LENGTH=46 /DNA_ID= /DNA_START= /DNA_END= /DNA_ORIENTATION=